MARAVSIEHIDALKLPHQKIDMLQRLENLDRRLKEILWAEVDAGNRIVDVAEDKQSLCVSLTQPFRETYPTTNDLRFSAESDPHYNESQYVVAIKMSGSVVEQNKTHSLSAPFQK